MRCRLFVTLFLLAAAANVAAADFGTDPDALGDRIRADFGALFEPHELARLGAVLVVSGALANTDADQEIREKWQEDFRGQPIDDFMEVFEEYGNVAHPIASIPIFWFTRRHALKHDKPRLYTWSDQSLRAMILAFPQHVVLRRVIGSPRPPDGPSDWDPFEDAAGVSGHAVYGAIPFMTAARMAESRGEQALWWGLSTLSGLSRVHRDRHYLSQFVAGWGIAWQATRITRKVDAGERAGGLALAPLADGVLLTGSWSWD